MKRFIVFSLSLAIVLSLAAPALAHFGMAIPSKSLFTPQNKSIDVVFSFSHPFAGQGMELVKPARAGVFFEGETSDVLESLEKASVMGHTAWSLDYTAGRPGVYTFFMEPEPYWEPAEDLFIIHYTKVLVPAFGGEEGWDEPVGLACEIVPMLRPFGNYAGNTFTGKVLRDGEPVPGAEVEVELYNQGRFEMPTAYHETQVIVADEEGIFSFTCPRSGWWGFSALMEADYTMPAPDGSGDKGVETGGVLWVHMDEWQEK